MILIGITDKRQAMRIEGLHLAAKPFEDPRTFFGDKPTERPLTQ